VGAAPPQNGPEPFHTQMHKSNSWTNIPLVLVRGLCRPVAEFTLGGRLLAAKARADPGVIFRKFSLVH
jgi:hypothetical protein